MRALINLFLGLPWWGMVAVALALAAFAAFLGWYIRRRFDEIVNETVVNAGAALKGAELTVHSATAVPLPSRSSPYDINRDDEDFVEGVDDAPWDNDGVSYYAIDVTITPVDPAAAWDPTALSLVPADYAPGDPTEITEQLCPLHSAELFAGGRFQPAREVELHGPQRLRMVFAVHDGLRAVKFALFVTYFGRVDLPLPLPKFPKASPSFGK